MELSRIERHRCEQKAAVKRTWVFFLCVLSLSGLALALYKGFVLESTSIITLLFFILLLGDIGNVRRYLPGLNNTRPVIRVISAFAYVLATLALVSWVAMITAK